MKKRINKISLVIVTLLGLVFMTQFGCGGPKKPSDLPKLYSCTLTVTQDGSPLAGATVLLFSEDKSLNKWNISGITDASGVVKMNTHNFKGVPVGNYIVTVTKVEQEGSGLVEINGEMMTKPTKNFNLVEEVYMDKDKSPLKLIQEAKSNTQEIKAGKKVRIEVTKKMELAV